MASQSARRLQASDKELVRLVLTEMVTRLKRSKRKAMYQYMNAEVALKALYRMEHVYILHEGYLVAFDLSTPWWADEGLIFLEELLVLRLAVSGDFACVPEFLGAQAQAAGAVLAVAGTALARSDRALEALYRRAGFSTQALTLIKEP